MALISELRIELKKCADPEKARILQRFFKTGKGEYGEGDFFLGVVVPKQRMIARAFREAEFEELEILLDSKVHEERLVALLILVEKYKKGDENLKKRVFDFYINHLERVNNWDLVDLSAHKIVGDYLLKRDRKILYLLVGSKNLWERRVAIISTFAFIRVGEFEDSLKLSDLLLRDEHDLIHKAVGWMLREVGKKDEATLKRYLAQRYKNMPRTMLRYAIEKFPEDLRKKYLLGKV
jgi:3-methyladenine DNA glycosylase AlkD